MKADHLLRTLALVMLTALLVAVVLLLVEVRQVSSALAAETIRDRGAGLQQAMQQLALSEDLAEVLAKARGGSLEALSESEQIRLWAWEFARSIRMQRQFNDYALGHLDEAAYRVMLSNAAEAYPLWQKLGIRFSDPELVAAVTRQMQAADFVAPPETGTPERREGGTR